MVNSILQVFLIKKQPQFVCNLLTIMHPERILNPELMIMNHRITENTVEYLKLSNTSDLQSRVDKMSGPYESDGLIFYIIAG